DARGSKPSTAFAMLSPLPRPAPHHAGRRWWTRKIYESPLRPGGMNFLKEPSGSRHRVLDSRRKGNPVHAIRSWALVAVFTAVLAGCGGGDSESSGAGEEAQAPGAKEGPTEGPRPAEG